jgi:hypothetical protein
MRITTFILLLIATVGCRAAAGQATHTRDSAGVRIVENPARTTFPVNLHLGTHAMLDVGGLQPNPDDEFDGHQGYLRAARLSDGGLAVIDVHRIQYFNARGQRIRIVGRQGAGPADFGYLDAICSTRGDTVVVSDSRNNRLAVVAPGGHVVHTLPLGGRSVEAPVDICFNDGTLLLQTSPPVAAGAVQTVHDSRVRLDGSPVNSLGVFAATPFDFVTMIQSTAVAAGGRFYIGNVASSEISVYGIDGRLISQVRSADRPHRISGAEVERRLAATFRSQQQLIARARSMSHATNWPAFARVEVDARQRIWVEDYQIIDPALDAWSVFDAGGTLIGRLVVPLPAAKNERPMEVIAFGHDDVLVRRSDDDGAQHLTVYPVVGLPR